MTEDFLGLSYRDDRFRARQLRPMMKRVPGEDPYQIRRWQSSEVRVRQSESSSARVLPATCLQFGRCNLEPAQSFFSRGRRDGRPDLARCADSRGKTPGREQAGQNRPAQQESFPCRQNDPHRWSSIQFAFHGLDSEAEVLGDLWRETTSLLRPDGSTRPARSRRPRRGKLPPRLDVVREPVRAGATF